MLSIVICSVRVRSGSAYSRINLLHVSLLTYVWVKVREIPQDGLLLLLRDVSSLKLKVFLLMLLRKHCALQHRNCL